MKKTSSGFTLIEMLIVLIIIGMLFSITIPVSYSTYERYQASLKAQKFLMYLNTIRLNSFLYGQQNIISSKDGQLLINGNTTNQTKDIKVSLQSPIYFYPTGATSNGQINLNIKDFAFKITIQSPSGNFTLTQ
jgi:prepilin-type N-terminal cleavage/methylation domain-containing protein